MEKDLVIKQPKLLDFIKSLAHQKPSSFNHKSSKQRLDLENNNNKLSQQLYTLRTITCRSIGNQHIQISKVIDVSTLQLCRSQKVEK